VVRGLEVSDLETEVLRAEVLLSDKGHWEGDPTHGLGCLARDDAEEGLVTCCQPLEVEVHFLQGLNEDDVKPAPTTDEGRREQATLDYWLEDEGVGPKIWDMDLVVGPGEHDWLLRPTQGL
jgi:hypothetical protein